MISRNIEPGTWAANIIWARCDEIMGSVTGGRNFMTTGLQPRKTIFRSAIRVRRHIRSSTRMVGIVRTGSVTLVKGIRLTPTNMRVNDGSTGNPREGSDGADRQQSGKGESG